MANYRTPGVYVEEVSTLPPSVAEVSTAVPVFIGYTEKSGDLRYQPVKIDTMLEFEENFGKAFPESFELTTKTTSTGEVVIGSVTRKSTRNYLLYYSLKLFFDNGGGSCYIVSTGDFIQTPVEADFKTALDNLQKEDEPTLILLTDAVNLAPEVYYNLCALALAQCADLGDRFLIADVVEGGGLSANVKFLRDKIGTNNLKYGAAYTPYLQTLIPYQYKEENITLASFSTTASTTRKEGALGDNVCKLAYDGGASAPSVSVAKGTKTGAITFSIADQTLSIDNVSGKSGKDIVNAWIAWAKDNDPKGFSISEGTDNIPAINTTTSIQLVSVATSAGNNLAALKDRFTGLYNKVKAEMAKQRITLPSSAAVAGIYARTDRERGVWKAPANISINSVLGPTLKVNDNEQRNLNIDEDAGKSINAIRAFTGKGTLVWGARTLAGNDNEWRYISVRRLFNLIEESTKKSTAFAVFEPNDATTWLKVKAMIDSYLYGLWQQGALAGANPEAAYFVNVGLGKTMTSQDVLEGRLIVEIGIAAVRPAEFIVLRFMHKLQEA
jgi:uncharacterized protein